MHEDLLDVDLVCKADIACVHEVSVGMAHSLAGVMSASGQSTLFAPYGPDTLDHLGTLLVWKHATFELVGAELGRPVTETGQDVWASPTNTLQNVVFKHLETKAMFSTVNYRLPACTLGFQAATFNQILDKCHPNLLCVTGVADAGVHNIIAAHGMVTVSDCDHPSSLESECLVGLSSAVAKDVVVRTKDIQAFVMLAEVPLRKEPPVFADA